MRINIFMIYMAICSFVLCMASDQTSFMKGNRFYKQQAFDMALHAYQIIKNKTPAVWYNMGNAAFGQGAYHKARLYWLRAQKYGNATIYKDSSYNLTYLDTVIYNKQTGLVDSIYWLLLLATKYIPLLLSQLLFLGAWYLLFFYKEPFYKKYMFLFLWFFILVSSITTVLIAFHANRKKGVILSDQALYNGPNKSFYTIDTISKGSVVAIKMEEKKWYKIAYDDYVGWVEHEGLAVI